jgi:glycosyltransferase involved in cell wall biosynthesis
MNIVWFSEIKWDYLKTRKQQIIRRKPSDVNFLYLEPYVKGRVNRYRLRKEGDIFCATVPFVKAVPGGPLRGILDQEWVRNTVDRYARRRVSRLIDEAGFDPVDTGRIVSNVYAIHVADRIPGRFLLYDCNDAHSAFPGMPPWTEKYYEASCGRADAVFTSSSALLEDAAAIRGREEGCELIGNGVEYGHFQSVREQLGWPPTPDPPRVGYLGAVAPWFNFEFVESLAHAHPDWEIAIVGPVMLGVDDAVGRLSRLTNVSIHEPVAYEDVPGVLRTFTLGVIPFRFDALTRGVNPNKMYEYLAMGLPVVASRFSTEVMRYPDVVETADTADEFVSACEAFVSLVADGSSLAAHRERAVEIAAGNDWAAIASRFWEGVEALDAGGD